MPLHLVQHAPRAAERQPMEFDGIRFDFRIGQLLALGRIIAVTWDFTNQRTILELAQSDGL